MTADAKLGPDGVPSIAWDDVEREYGARPAVQALDVIMRAIRADGGAFDWPDTKARALHYLQTGRVEL